MWEAAIMAKTTDSKKPRTAAKKKAPSGSGKKTASAKSGGSARKVSPPPAPAAEPGGNRGPFLVLVIMILVAVIAFLLNRQYSEKIKTFIPMHHKSAPSAERPAGETHVSEQVEKKPVLKKDDNGSPALQPANKPEAESAKDVQVYLMAFNEKTEALSLHSVRRTVTGASPLDGALRELLKGPSAAEKKKGLITAIPRGLQIRSISVHEGIAEIDFNEHIEDGGTGNIMLSRIDQIVYTATQFDTVKAVTLRVNGKKRKTLGSDGLSVEGPLHRKR